MSREVQQSLIDSEAAVAILEDFFQQDGLNAEVLQAGTGTIDYGARLTAKETREKQGRKTNLFVTIRADSRSDGPLFSCHFSPVLLRPALSDIGAPTKVKNPAIPQVTYASWRKEMMDRASSYRAKTETGDPNFRGKSRKSKKKRKRK